MNEKGDKSCTKLRREEQRGMNCVQPSPDMSRGEHLQGVAYIRKPVTFSYYIQVLRPTEHNILISRGRREHRSRNVATTAYKEWLSSPLNLLSARSADLLSVQVSSPRGEGDGLAARFCLMPRQNCHVWSTLVLP